MAEGINVRLPAKLKAFVDEKASPDGMYGSASEYIRDLVRHDMEQSQAESWDRLNSHLQRVMEQPLENRRSLSADDVIARAKQRKQAVA